jgi:hypothetical protein
MIGRNDSRTDAMLGFRIPMNPGKSINGLR